MDHMTRLSYPWFGYMQIKSVFFEFNVMITPILVFFLLHIAKNLHKNSPELHNLIYQKRCLVKLFLLKESKVMWKALQNFKNNV